MSIPCFPTSARAAWAPATTPLHFADASPRLTGAQAVLEAERCLYCFDAPCVTACPTGIDVPSFIRRIADGNLRGAARTILESNPLGGMCARVCPTETLCEAACVCTTQEGKPVAIGRLQRHAVDAVMDSDRPQLFTRAASTGARSPSWAPGRPGWPARTRWRGSATTWWCSMPGPRPAASTNTAWPPTRRRTTSPSAKCGGCWPSAASRCAPAGSSNRLPSLTHCARTTAPCSSAWAWRRTHPLGVPGEELAGVEDAVDFIARLRQSEDKSLLPIGRRVVVIGGGMTAVDAAVQSRLLGAESVHIVYRRGPETMSASSDEQHWAQTNGVTIRHWLAPVEVSGEDGQASGVTFARQALVNGRLQPTGDTEFIAADMVFKAIGQTLGNPVLAEAGLAMEGGRLKRPQTARPACPASGPAATAAPAGWT